MNRPTVAQAVGQALGKAGIGTVYGVVGSGNFAVTHALVASGARFVAARHENGAACMADAHSRLTGKPVAVSLHQGPGFTNALTGIVEAAKSHSPVVVIAAATPDIARTSNFWIDQASVAQALGCAVVAIASPFSAVSDARRSVRMAATERQTVVLLLPTDLIDAPSMNPPGDEAELSISQRRGPGIMRQSAPQRLADLLAGASRPVFIAGRGAANARDELVELADRCGALLATSAVARGLFSGHPWNLDVSGGFATPAAAELIAEADLIVSWGAALNRWTTRSGELLRGATTVVQIDDRPAALGQHVTPDVALLADVATLAVETLPLLNASNAGYRQEAVAERIRLHGDWRHEEYVDTSTLDRVDPRAATTALDAILPAERIVVTDGGNFNGYPAMFFATQDVGGTVLPLAFQSIGLALAHAIGAAVATPDRVVIAGVGDGGFLMSAVELDTAVRLKIPLVVVVYNDNAYGAEVHHFELDEVGNGLVTFPDTDIAEIARGYGCDATTMRTADDTKDVTAWVEGDRGRPLVIDVKMTSFPSWMLAHTFVAVE